ncbi:MAG: protein-glutamate methylesterase/protein-glutamine glutaminase [Nitrospirota bacterium]
MADPIRVLVVDDSAVVRRAVSDALASEPDITVVGTAANGKIGLERAAHLKPDVVILDIEMPEANGFDVLRGLRAQHATARTIMFSTLTQRGASQTVEALALGASDYALKPASTGLGYGDTLKQVAKELIPKIKQFRPDLWPAAPPPFAAPAGAPRCPSAREAGTPQVVAIGVSTGGPEALAKVLPRLPETFPTPILIVQHMPPVFTKLLAERLALSSKIKVVEAEAGMTPQPGTAYLAPGDHHMVVGRRDGRVAISLNQAAPENSCRPAADPLFRSVAEVYGAHALGVIMTGMGQDGLIGLRAMRAKGAGVYAQDQATSVVWGMPSFPVREGLVDAVLSVDELAAAIDAAVSSHPAGAVR